MQVIAIVNQKGGCGKTTTSVNLASVLAARGMRVLLVDLDPQSHCAAGLGVPEDRIEYSTLDFLLEPDQRPFDPVSFAACTWEVSHGLRLLPSRVKLAAAEAPGGGLMERPDRDRRLMGALTRFEGLVDICIVDCPPTIGLLTFNALRAASEVLVPVETGFFSARGAARQWSTLQAMATRLQRPVAARVLPNLVREESDLDNDLLRSLRRRFGGAICPTVVREHSVIREATGLGRPVVEHAPDSSARADYEQVADWMLSTPPAMITPVQPEAVDPEVADSKEREVGAPNSGSGEVPPAEITAAVPGRLGELMKRLEDPEVAEDVGGGSVSPGPSVRPGTLRILQPIEMGERISVTGDFNQWHGMGLPLRPNPEAWGPGMVGIEMPVRSGMLRYRLVVDGVGAPDPANPAHGAGPDNLPCSVIEVPSMAAESDEWTQNATPMTS